MLRRLVERFLRWLCSGFGLGGPWCGQRRRSFNGRITVSLEGSVVDAMENDFVVDHEVSLADLVSAGFAPSLGTLLARLGNPSTGRMVRTQSVGAVAADARTWPTPSGLRVNSYFWIYLPGRSVRRLERIATDLRADRSIRDAWLEPTVRGASPTLEPVPAQRYIRGDHTAGQTEAFSESGVNAAAVWGSLTGKGVALATVDIGFKQHVDFKPGPPPTALLNAATGGQNTTPNHGTQALGIVGARKNGFGIIGIAPEITFSGVSSVWIDDGTGTGKTINDFGNAFNASAAVLGAGDVLLIEVDVSAALVTEGPITSGLPVEVHEPWRTLIEAAVAKGITVIEPSGNPSCSGMGCNLDTLPYASGETPDRSMDPGSCDFVDSGAILVGACSPATNGVGQESLDPNNWFGARIDCYGWGMNAYTTSCMGSKVEDDGTTKVVDQCSGAPDADVYLDFGGTSAASAMIAGAAAVVQQWYIDETGSPAAPAQVRAVLSDTNNGVIVDAPGDDRSMPDLDLVRAALPSGCDLVIRDSLADDGTEPAATVSMSPDVFVKGSKADVPAYWAPDAMIQNDKVVPAADNWVFLRVRNRSKHAAAVGVVSRIYWANAATILVPTDWKLIEEFVMGPIPPDSFSVTTHPTAWRPSPAELPLGAHACLIAIVHHADDPAPAIATPLADWAAFRQFIGSSNNVAWRNFNVVPAAAAPPDLAPPAGDRAPGANAAPEENAWPAAFLIRGDPERERIFDFRLEVWGLGDAELFWKLPADLADRFATGSVAVEPTETRDSRTREPVWVLREDGVFHFERISLPADTRAASAFAVYAPYGPGTEATLVALIQMEDGIEIGRVTWRFDPPSDA